MTEHSELRPRLPLIAVPTTAGTGSETTNVTVIIDAVSGRKQVLAHASLMPDVAILDAALTEGVPPHITAMTGIDALTHAVEAYSARHATPFTDSLAMGAIAMIGEALPKAVGCGQDLAARENMLLASCMAGMAFSSAGLGLCHAMAHQPGAALHIPHGLANAMLLPTVMEFNRMVRRAHFSQIGRALTGKKTDDREAIAAVRELIAEVGLTMRLTEAGATSAHYAARRKRRRRTSVCAPIHAPPAGSRLSSCTRRRNKCRFSRRRVAVAFPARAALSRATGSQPSAMP